MGISPMTVSTIAMLAVLLPGPPQAPMDRELRQAWRRGGRRVLHPSILSAPPASDTRQLPPGGDLISRSRRAIEMVCACYTEVFEVPLRLAGLASSLMPT